MSALSRVAVSGPQRVAGRRQRRVPYFTWFSGVLVLAVAVLTVYPLGRVIVRLFIRDGHLTAAPITSTLSYPDLDRILLNTFILLAASGIAAFVLGSAMAWLNERTDARMGPLTDGLPLVPFLLPPIAGAIGWVMLLSDKSGYLNLILRKVLAVIGVNLDSGPLSINSWYALIWVYMLYMVPFVYVIMSAGMRNMDGALEEQSRVCGWGPLGTLRNVVIPSLRPSVLSSIFVLVWFGTALYSVPAVIARPAGIDVLTVEIVQLLAFTFPPNVDSAVGLSCIILLALAVFWALQRRALRSNRFGLVTGKATRAPRVRLGLWKWPLRCIFFGYITAAVVLPFAALLIVTLNGYWSAHINWGSFSFDAFREALSERRSVDAIKDSVLLGAGAATVGAVIAAIISVFVYGKRVNGGSKLLRALRWSGDASVKLPTAVPNVVLAIGFILALGGAPLYLGGTVAILFLAYLVLYLPQASIASDGAFGQIGSELPEASRVSGAGPGRTFVGIYLPLLLPGLFAGWSLLFTRVVSDVEASSILAGPRTPVAGVEIMTIYSNGIFSDLAAMSVLLVTISGATLAVMMAISKWLAPGRGPRRPWRAAIGIKGRNS